MNEIKVAEARIMLGFQYMMENIHGEVYSNMLNNIVENVEERNRKNGNKGRISCKPIT